MTDGNGNYGFRTTSGEYALVDTNNALCAAVLEEETMDESTTSRGDGNVTTTMIEYPSTVMLVCDEGENGSRGYFRGSENDYQSMDGARRCFRRDALGVHHVTYLLLTCVNLAIYSMNLYV